MIKYVLLDLDETILDFLRSEREALERTLLLVGVEPTDAIAKRYSVINDAHWKRLEKGELTRDEVKRGRFEQLFAELGVVYDAEIARKYYEEQITTIAYFLPDAERLLEALYQRYELYIVSNGTSAVQHGRITKLGLERYFQKIFLSEEIGFVKPRREFFDRCFAEIDGFDPDRAIIVGDSLTSDIRGGINAGIKTCWVNLKGMTAKEIAPTVTVTELMQIPSVLETLE